MSLFSGILRLVQKPPVAFGATGRPPSSDVDGPYILAVDRHRKIDDAADRAQGERTNVLCLDGHGLSAHKSRGDHPLVAVSSELIDGHPVGAVVTQAVGRQRDVLRISQLALVQ